MGSHQPAAGGPRPPPGGGGTCLRGGRTGLPTGAPLRAAVRRRAAVPGPPRRGGRGAAAGPRSPARAAGSIGRGEGGLWGVAPPVKPIPDAGDGLRAFAGPTMVYAVDARRGVLTAADPRTLAPRSGQLSLAARFDTQSATLDDRGRLWLLDPGTGDLIWVRDGQRHVRHNAARPGAGMLALAGGVPVLIDPQRGAALTLDPETADAAQTTELDLRPDDRIQVSGAPDAARLYVVAARGVLAVCDLTASACGTVVPLAAGGSDFGAAVESGRRVFVPDYTTGRVWIVDLDRSAVVAQPQVVSPRTRFQLLTRDGVVFFNDPDSEHAGVIRLDGGVRPVAKYNPRNPGAGLTNSGNGAGSADGPTG